MKKNIFILFLLGIISFASCSFTDKKFEYTGDKEKLLMEIIQYMVSRGHYDQQPLDDAYSKRVFKGYIQYLDPQKRYFIQEDIDEFKNYLKALPEKILSTAPAIVSETAVEYYKERFAVKGFDGSPWIPGRPKKSGSLLVQSGNLMNSIRPAYVGPDKVIISAGNAQVPYAQVHNEGFEGDVAIQSYVRSTKGKANKKKADAGDAPGHMKIPQRQFMGDARELSDRIKDRLNAAISSIL